MKSTVPCIYNGHVNTVLYSFNETALCGAVHGRAEKLVVGGLITCSAVGGAVHG